MYQVMPEDWKNHPILNAAIDKLVANIIKGNYQWLGFAKVTNDKVGPLDKNIIKYKVIDFLSSGNVKAGKMFASNLLVDEYGDACEKLGGPSQYNPKGKYKCLKRAGDYSDREFLKGFSVQYKRYLTAMSAPLEETKTTLNKSYLIKIIKEEVESVLAEKPVAGTAPKSFKTTTDVTMRNYPALIMNSGNQVLLAYYGLDDSTEKKKKETFGKFNKILDSYMDTVSASKDSGQLTKQEYDTVVATLTDKSKPLPTRIQQVTKQMDAKMKSK